MKISKENIGFGLIGLLMIFSGINNILSGKAGGIPGTRTYYLKGAPAFLGGCVLISIGGFVVYRIIREIIN